MEFKFKIPHYESAKQRKNCHDSDLAYSVIDLDMLFGTLTKIILITMYTYNP